MKGGHNVGLQEQFMTPLQVVGLMPVHLSGGFRIIFKKVSSLSGEKVIIGDNLVRYYSPTIISTCNEMGIKFISLIYNTTHLCQPLDVAVFRPLKKVWRTILVNWCKESRNKGTILK